MKPFSLLIGVILLLNACNSKVVKEDTHALPNVLLIIADDHGYADISAHDLVDDVSTPSIDMLAENGMKFTNAYASSPICSPSRVGLMTGVYQQRQNVLWYGGNGLSDPSIPTIAEVLRQNGYTTGYIGKYHYGSHDAKTDHRSFPLNHGFDTLIGFSAGRKHYLIHDNEKEAAFRKLMTEAVSPKQSLKMEGFWIQDKQETIEGFSTEILGEKARDFMGDQIKNQQPFFLTLSFNAVHNFTHQLPKEYLDQHNLKGYRDWNPEIESYYDWYVKGRKPFNPEGREHYLGQLYYLDKEIGKVTDFLAAQGQLENTLIIYIGDNGGSTQIYADNRPFNGGKYTMYEGGLRVPLIVSWKGKYPDKITSKNLVSALDILPTICEAANVPTPELMDGISLHDLLTGKNKDIQHEVLYWLGGDQAAIRKGNWKYRWANDSENSGARSNSKFEGVALELGEFLYDLERDAAESSNLKDHNNEKLEELKMELEQWKTQVLPK